MGGKASKGLVRKLEEREINRIKALHEDLTAASKGKQGIDLDTFKQLLAFPDPIGAQVFRVFDHKKTGHINLEDFTNGMALCARGAEKDKVKALFRVFDHDDDKHIHKPQVKTILSAFATSELWTSTGDTKPPSPLVQSLMEMGFPRDLCEKASESVKNGDMDAAINWILANKDKSSPDKEAQDLIDSMFESVSDGNLSWSKFKKWALSSKRPARVLTLINAITGIFVRASNYYAPVKITTSNGDKPPMDLLIDFSAPLADEGEKKVKRSLSMRLKRKTSQTNVNDPGLFDNLPPSVTPPLTPQKPLEPSKQRPLSTSGIAAIDLTGASPVVTTTAPPKRVPSSFNLAPSPTTTRARSVTTGGGGTSLAPPINLTGSSELVRKPADSSDGIDPPPQKPLGGGDDDWSDSDEEKEHKPAIQVIIKERSEVAVSSGVDLKKFASQLSLDVPKATKTRGNTVGSRRGHRQTSSKIDNMFDQPESKESSFGPSRSESPLPSPASTPSTPVAPVVIPATSISAQNTPVKEDNWFAKSSTSISVTPVEANPTEESPKPQTPTLARSTTSPAFPAPQAKPAAQPTTSPQPATSPQQPAQRPGSATVDAGEFMRNAMTLLEKGNFTEALENVNNSIRVFLAKPDPQAVKGETNFCVAYKVALWLLIALREQEGQLASEFGENPDVVFKMALWSRFLTEIPLKPNHRAVCVRMAIKRNMQAKNYGIAGRLLEAMLLKGAPDREELQLKLRKCKEENNNNASLPSYKCPGCGNDCNPAAVKCACGRPVRWCFKTFAIITEKNFTQCGFCNAIFSSKVHNSGDSCLCCFSGPLQQKE